MPCKCPHNPELVTRSAGAPTCSAQLDSVGMHLCTVVNTCACLGECGCVGQCADPVEEPLSELCPGHTHAGGAGGVVGVRHGAQVGVVLAAERVKGDTEQGQ
jgi:hypothetical protein